jgi:ABC-2 type transport system ATP-binding protein
VRRAIGYVAQKSGIDPAATGRENLVLQGQIHGISGGTLRTRVAELLERFGLAADQKRPAATYSGGMQRRLDIALGLIHQPRVLFLDEPTTGLDPEVRAAMWEEISTLAGNEGLTILLTHHMEEADRLASRLAIVDRGRVVTEGSPEQLKSELRGDALRIELSEVNGNGRVTAALGRVAELRDIVVDGRLLYARADDGARAVPIVLQALEANQVSVASVTVARPSLDDVYLRHAGRTFDKAEAEASEVKK